MRGNGTDLCRGGGDRSRKMPAPLIRSDFVASMDDVDVRGEIVALLPRLRRFALSLTGSNEDADDLLQSAVERALARLDQWQRGTRLDSWMYRIIQTVRIDQTRASANRQRHVSLDEEGHGVSVSKTDDDAEARIGLEAVLGAMRRLPESDRTVLTLVCIDGMRYREAAEILDLPVGTVMSRLARARRRLHDLVYGPGPRGRDEDK